MVGLRSVHLVAFAALLGACGQIFFTEASRGDSDASQDLREEDASVPRDAAAVDVGSADRSLIDGSALDSAVDGDEPRTDGGEAGCPERYVRVPANDALSVSSFCVMQFEAKAWEDRNGDRVVDASELDGTGCGPACSAGFGALTHLPVSAPDAQPWRNVSQQEASSLCRALGPGFDLIANAEWMALARNLELEPSNWTGLEVGSGRLPEGNTDSSTTRPSPLDVRDGAAPFDGTGNTPEAGPEQRRMLRLSTGSAVWDLAGNVQEWVDWRVGGSLSEPPECPRATEELNNVMCPGLRNDDYNSEAGTYDRSQGVGRVIGGAGGAARRGGQTGDLDLELAGIYALNLNRAPTFRAPATGFRCVFRPE